jgi:hypothetical protein
MAMPLLELENRSSVFGTKLRSNENGRLSIEAKDDLPAIDLDLPAVGIFFVGTPGAFPKNQRQIGD